MKLKTDMPTLARSLSGNPNIPRVDLPPGSKEWCYRTLEVLHGALGSIETSETYFNGILEQLVQQRAWDIIPDREHPYGSLDAMLKAEIGITSGEATRQKAEQQREQAGRLADNAKPMPEQEFGKGKPGPGRGNKTDSDTTRFNDGRGAGYLTDRIARDRPDILERMKAREFASVAEAARAAGIDTRGRRVWLARDPGKAAATILKHFNGNSLSELVRILTEAINHE